MSTVKDKSPRDAVIVEALRTPIGKRGKSLSQVHPVELAGYLLRGLLEKVGLPSSQVEDVILGCNTQIGEQGLNVARQAVLAAGFPITVPGTSINRMCASSDQAVAFASQAIVAGDMDVLIAGGVESMSRVPMGADGGGLSRQVTEQYRLVPQGISAELLAERWDLSREELDRYSLMSHQRALKAWEEGGFEREVLPVDLATAGGRRVVLARDEGPRSDTSLEKLSALEPAFKPGGKITAGNSSQISDGVAALLVMAREKAERLGLRPRARILAKAVVGDDPTFQLAGPIPATRRVLERAGLSLTEMDVVEVNEAFASVVLAWARELQPNPARVNPQGGAIALGHPLGATGARLLVTLLHELERTRGHYGLSTMCIGHGMANATILECEG